MHCQLLLPGICTHCQRKAPFEEVYTAEFESHLLSKIVRDRIWHNRHISNTCNFQLLLIVIYSSSCYNYGCETWTPILSMFEHTSAKTASRQWSVCLIFGSLSTQLACQTHFQPRLIVCKCYVGVAYESVCELAGSEKIQL